VTSLSGYRIMWMMVMFDLPVGTPAEQKAAGDFRNDLLDLGFEMAQYSIYLRCCSGRPQCEVYVGRVKNMLPAVTDRLIGATEDRRNGATLGWLKRDSNGVSGCGVFGVFCNH
jgi:CRISPR-associated protein Cas2